MEKKQNGSILKYRKCLKDILLSLKHGFKQHKLLFQSNLEIQKNILNHMCVLGHRMLKLASGPLPRAQCDQDEENKIKKEFRAKKDELCSSNVKLDTSYNHLIHTCRKFKSFLEKIIGPRPLLFCEPDLSDPLFFDLEQYSMYFGFTQSVLANFSSLLALENMHSMLNYKELLEPNEETMESLEGAANKAIDEFHN